MAQETLANRRRAQDLAAEPHSTDRAAALVFATLSLLRRAALGVVGAMFRPRLHVRAAVLTALASFLGLCLSQFVPSFLISWLVVVAFLLTPGFLARGLSADAVLSATKVKKEE